MGGEQLQFRVEWPHGETIFNQRPVGNEEVSWEVLEGEEMTSARPGSPEKSE